MMAKPVIIYATLTFNSEEINTYGENPSYLQAIRHQVTNMIAHELEPLLGEPEIKPKLNEFGRLWSATQATRSP